MSHFESLMEKDRESSIFSHRKIDNRELDAHKIALQNSDTRYHKISGGLVSHPSQRTGGSRSTHHHIGIQGFKLSKKFDIAIREIVIREIAIRSQPSICPDMWQTS
jgi:hypothetical protein